MRDEGFEGSDEEPEKRQAVVSREIRLLFFFFEKLVLVTRGEVLGARRRSVPGIRAVQRVLGEETTVILLHKTWPDRWSFC